MEAASRKEETNNMPSASEQQFGRGHLQVTCRITIKVNNIYIYIYIYIYNIYIYIYIYIYRPSAGDVPDNN